MITTQFWNGRRIFLTGHTGFKGGWLALWLQSMGAVIKGYSLPPKGEKCLYNLFDLGGSIESEFGDVRDLSTLARSLQDFQPEIVIHMAAQPLVRASYADPLETFSTNVMGVANLLEAVYRCSSVNVLLNVTTDKCYENQEWVWGYRESEPMGGKDPYSASKACAELVTSAYRDSFFSEEGAVSVATARAGNVIGGGDWSADRLIPDAITSFIEGRPCVIRNPAATRPWQHVLEPLAGYMSLIEGMASDKVAFSSAWNFGPRETDVATVESVMNKMVALWPDNASWERDMSSQPHEAQLLKLDISKALNNLPWRPKWDLDTALSETVRWYREHNIGQDMKVFSLNQIAAFMNTAGHDKGK